MKVVLSTPSFFPNSFGGGEVYVDRVARELTRRGHAPTVVTASPRSPGDPQAEVGRYEYGCIPVVSFAPLGVGHEEAHTGMGPEAQRILARIVSELRPDLVHINGWKPALAAVCRSLEVPHVVTAHHAGIACPAGTLVRPGGEVCQVPMSAGCCVPCANRARRPQWNAGRLLGGIPAWIYRGVGRRLSARPKLGYLGRGLIYSWLVERAIAAKRTVLEDRALVIAPSAAMQELLIRNGRAADRVVVVPHGIEPLARAPLAPMGGRPVRFGYVGRIDPLKGLHVLLAALQAVKPADGWELHVFGAARTPWDAKYLARTLEQEATGRVRFHGQADHRGLSSAFAAFDVLVVPSLLPEAFGLVVLESFSAGRPVVVFPSGGLAELVRDGVDGLVVPRRDASSLANTLQPCIDHPEMVVKMAAAVPAPRGMEAHVDDLLRVYERAIADA